jgi:hypothetical protein
MALDRDGDGFYDGDERRAGSDPADPNSVPTAFAKRDDDDKDEDDDD